MYNRATPRRQSALLFLAATATAALLSPPAQATNLNVNLITNPGGESNTGASNFTSVVTPAGWTTTGNFTVIKYSIGGANDLNSADSTAISGGANYFAGGPNNPGATSTATQTIDISDLAATTANGYVGSLSAFLGGWASQADNMQLSLQFFRADGGMINDLTLGPVTNTDRANTSQLLPVSQIFSVPSGTTQLKLVMTATGGTGAQYNDGYADNLSLTLSDHRTVTWVGPNSGAQWKDSVNWSPNIAPTNSAYDAVFSNGANVNVLVNGPRNGGTLAVRSATTLTLTNGDLTLHSTSAASVAVSGSSTLNLASGMSLTSGGALIAPVGTAGTGTVNVPAGASWTSTGNIQLGGSGTARLNVGGSVQSDTLNSTNLSFLTLQGGTATANSATLAGFLSGNGTLAAPTTLTPSSTISVTGGAMTVGSASSTSGFSAAGTVSVGAQTLTLLDADNAVITGPLSLNGGTVNAANGLTLGGTAATTHSLAGTINAPLNILAGPTISFTGNLTTGTLTSAAPLNLAARTLTISGTSPSTISGALTLAGGTINAPGGLTLSGIPGTTHSLAGTINAPTTIVSAIASGTQVDLTGNLTLSTPLSSAAVFNVGTRTLTLLGPGPATFTGPLTVLPGGSITSSTGITLGGVGTPHSLGGSLNLLISLQPGATLSLNANLTAGDATSPTGIILNGDLDIGPHTFTPLSSTPPTLGGRLSMAGGTFATTGAITLANTNTPHSLHGTITAPVVLSPGAIADVTGPLHVGSPSATTGLSVAGYLNMGEPSFFSTPHTDYILTVDSTGPIDLTGTITLAGGSIHAPNGITISGAGQIHGRGIIYGPITDLTPGQIGLNAEVGGDNYDSIDVGAGEVTILGGASFLGTINNLSIAGGTLHRHMRKGTDSLTPWYYVNNLTGHGTLDGVLSLLSTANLTGPTTIRGIDIVGQINVGPHSLVLEDVLDSEPTSLLSVSTGSVHILSNPIYGGFIQSAIQLAGGSVNSDVPWGTSFSGFAPSSVSGFGYVSAAGLGRAPLPVATVSGGTIPSLPTAQLDNLFVLSASPIHVQPNSTLNGGSVYAPGGIVLDNADSISGAGFILGHVTDNTSGAGGLLPTAPLSNGTYYIPGGDSYLLASNSPNLHLRNSNAVTPSHLYAPNGLNIASTVGTAPLHIHGPASLLNTATIGTDTILHPDSTAPILLPYNLNFSSHAFLQSETGFTVPNDLPAGAFRFSGTGGIRGVISSPSANFTSPFNDLRVTGDINLGDPALSQPNLVRFLTVGSLADFGGPYVTSTFTLLNNGPASLEFGAVRTGQLIVPAGLSVDFLALAAGDPNTMTAALRTPDVYGIGSNRRLHAQFTAEVQTNHFHNTVVDASQATLTYLRAYTPGSTPTFSSNSSLVFAGTLLAPDGLVISSTSTLATQANSGQTEARIVGHLHHDGLASPFYDSNLPLVMQGLLTGNGTLAAPVTIDPNPSYTTTKFGGVTLSTGGGRINPGNVGSPGLLRFTKTLTLPASSATTTTSITFEITTANQRGVTYDAIDAANVSGNFRYAVEFNGQPVLDHLTDLPPGQVYRLMSYTNLSFSPTQNWSSSNTTQIGPQQGSFSILLARNPSAGDHVFANDSSRNVNASNSWLNNSLPTTPGHSARFPDAISANRLITLNTTLTAGLLQFDSPYRYTLTGGSTFHLDSTTGPAQIQILRGSQVLGARMQLHDDTTLTLSSPTAQFLLDGNGILDLANHTLTITGPADRSYFPTYLASAYHNGAWDLPGITSSNLPPNTSLGYYDDGTTLLIKPTLTGDANLNGAIDPDDYALLDRSLAVSRTNALWTEGDFNYDGSITSADYLLIDQTFLSQAPGFSPGFLAQRQSQFGADYVSALLTSIPEPSLALSSILYPLSSLFFARRRRIP